MARTCPTSPALSGGAGKRRSLPTPRNQVRQLPAPGSMVGSLVGLAARASLGSVDAPRAAVAAAPNLSRLRRSMAVLMRFFPLFMLGASMDHAWARWVLESV